ncbi:MAG: hypothetical protein ABI600_09485 [Luteolibacter sp.]
MMVPASWNVTWKMDGFINTGVDSRHSGRGGEEDEEDEEDEEY